MKGRLSAVPSSFILPPSSFALRPPSRSGFRSGEHEVEHDGVVVGENPAGLALQPADDARRGVRVGLYPAPGEPVELERAAPAVVPERPLYPPEAPAGHPLAHV